MRKDILRAAWRTLLELFLVVVFLAALSLLLHLADYIGIGWVFGLAAFVTLIVMTFVDNLRNGA